eukprot:CAMPEP_0171060912 /NCGR_PEP_ID=MMETSP0766_2-20121228/4103_1 /TAXON_ID=439317 /ORGANISM="Gambierdiscus australes, Strain CAWD 149" /LENGTH=99 /DNA_ID=CAMNT_0011516527 /DNA_START=224 /DNA_END=520 /DNA_ORIENTATION=+
MSFDRDQQDESVDRDTKMMSELPIGQRLGLRVDDHNSSREESLLPACWAWQGVEVEDNPILVQDDQSRHTLPHCQTGHHKQPRFFLKVPGGLVLQRRVT